MATEHPSSGGATERLILREHAGPVYLAAQVLGIVGLISAILLGYFDGDGFRRFFHSYLIAFMFFLAIALGGLFFVLVQHATKAAWSVNVRRIAEWYAASLPVMALMSAPIIIAVVLGKGALYPWTAPEWIAAEHGLFKGMWLNSGFFIARLVLYFLIWSVLGMWYWKQSVKQDHSGDIALTLRMQYAAPIGLVLFGLSVTFAAWDWIMALDPVWYSTIFGVYFFAGSTLTIFSMLILTTRWLQCRGLLRESVTTEHFHDLGKFLFAFVFFWGYIAFAQFMLQWYGNLSDETGWFLRHGASTLHPNEFSKVVIILLFGHLLIPFPGLLSRHVKRTTGSLTFWAVWMLFFCWFDLYWLIMPQFDNGKFHVGLIDLACLVGVGGVFFSFVLRRASHESVRVMRDPRLADSLAFENF